MAATSRAASSPPRAARDLARDVAPAGAPRRRLRAPQVGEALVAGFAVAGLVLALRAAGVIEGRGALVLLILLLLAVPTSREVSRRILVMGCLALGWVPLLWWTPVVPAGRAALLVAGVAGGLAAWVFHGPGRRYRIEHLVPRVRAVDALPLGAALAAAFVVRPWLRPGSGDSALSMLLRGWDHAAHYDIVHMLREHGRVIGVLGPALLGDSWSYGRYPQGFHAIAATLMELEAGPDPSSAQSEVLLYSQALGVLAVISTTIVAAGICAVPRLRRRPLVAAPLVAVVAGAFLLGPGGRLLSDGFPNFALACVLLACLPLLVVPAEKGPLPLHLAAIGGAVVGIAHGWALLLVMALPAVVVLLLPGRRRRFLATRNAWFATGAVVLATGFGTAVAVVMLAGQSVTEVLVIPGAITAPQLRLLVGPALLAVALCALLLWRRRRTGGRAVPGERGEVRRVAASGAVPLTGLAVAVGIAALQISAGAPLSYYFWKFAIALALVSLVVACLAVPWLLPGHVGLVSRRWPSWVAAGALTVVASQMYGLTVPPQASGWAAQGIHARSELLDSRAAPLPVATHLWAAAAADAAPGARHVVIVDPATAGVSPVTAGQWYNALTGRWTDQSNEALKVLFNPMSTPTELAGVVSTVLAQDPGTVVLLHPDRADEVEALLPADQAERTMSW